MEGIDAEAAADGGAGNGGSAAGRDVLPRNSEQPDSVTTRHATATAMVMDHHRLVTVLTGWIIRIVAPFFPRGGKSGTSG